LIRKASKKLDFLMFLHSKLGISKEFVCNKAGISRATFYRYKKEKSSKQ